MTVSIIIAAKTYSKNLEECVNKCLQLNYPDFEIILLPDEAPGRSLLSCRIKVIPTGFVSPAEKRDMAINYAKGEILAFIDDDAYPEKDWLKNAIKNFVDPPSSSSWRSCLNTCG
jgi:cellulose synthase/poly-beta-1,6-N-acetylglucosamine synthase-like glycosyltransferase